MSRRGLVSLGLKVGQGRLMLLKEEIGGGVFGVFVLLNEMGRKSMIKFCILRHQAILLRTVGIVPVAGKTADRTMLHAQPGADTLPLKV